MCVPEMTCGSRDLALEQMDVRMVRIHLSSYKKTVFTKLRRAKGWLRSIDCLESRWCCEGQ